MGRTHREYPTNAKVSNQRCIKKVAVDSRCPFTQPVATHQGKIVDQVYNDGLELCPTARRF